MAKRLLVDVSEHNGTIDWATAKNHIDGAILRCGYGGNATYQDDKQWARNANECDRLGIPYGVYLFSYARNVQEAVDEAVHVLRCIKGRKLAYPVYFDMEYSDYQGSLSKGNAAAFAKAFCEKIESAGYYVGVYANTNWWNTILTDKVFENWTRWVAQYYTVCTYAGSHDMWQFTSTQPIAGIGNHVDQNYCYVDFPTLIKEKGLNGFGGNTEVPDVKPEPTPEPTPNPGTPDEKHGVGEFVKFNNCHMSSTSADNLSPLKGEGTITKVIAGARNPYLINDGDCWINDGDIGSTVTAPTTKFGVGSYIKFKVCHISSTSTDSLKPLKGEGTITKVIKGARNPYLVNGGDCWVADGDITSGGSYYEDTTGDYIVKAGDTLSALAAAWGTTVDAIAKLNGISNPSLIFVGQTIKKPGKSEPAKVERTYTIKWGDTLSAIALKFGTTVDALCKMNGIANANVISVGQVIRY